MIRVTRLLGIRDIPFIPSLPSVAVGAQKNQENGRQDFESVDSAPN